jgi:hypothetical protein
MDNTIADFLVELSIGLFVGFLISWFMGLLPALIYRYIFYKKPIEKKRVFWRLAPIIIVLALLFKLTNAAISGEPPRGNPIPWIIIYYIGKWIMTRIPKGKANTGIAASTNQLQQVESESCLSASPSSISKE